MMIRSFLPVGQGAFYCEQFKRTNSKEWINVIYDCGASNNKKLVEELIRSNFNEKECITALFISHLDDDHINGIPYLLKHCDVKRIFFPLVTEKEYLIIMNSIKYGEESLANSFIENPRSVVPSRETQLYCVLPNDGFSEEYIALQPMGVSQIVSGADISRRVLGSEKDIGKYTEWKYIPYNFKQAVRIEQLKKALFEVFGEEIPIEELSDKWKNGDALERKLIKEAYSKVKGGMNTNSMTLFSGIQSSKISQRPTPTSLMSHGFDKYEYIYNYSKPNGCLFIGDYDASANWNELHDAYKQYWEYIGCVQVPHHGSIYSFNRKIAEMDTYFVISAGVSNRFCHPHTRVIKEFLMNKHVPIIVTEKYESMFLSCIDV